MTTLVRAVPSQNFETEKSLTPHLQVIAIHTFVVIWWRKAMHAVLFAKIIVAIIWLYVILFVAIGIGLNNRNGYEVPTPVSTLSKYLSLS
jgi:hypothetical protein